MLVSALISGGRIWSRGYFGFWILVAGCSAYYLFSTDPAALESQTFRPSATSTPVAGASRPALTTNQASDLRESVEHRGQELSEIQAILRELSQQMAGLDARLKPIEKFMALAKSSEHRDQKLSESQARLRDLPQQMAGPATRLEPTEKFVDSVPVLPAAPSLRTSRPMAKLPETLARKAPEPASPAESMPAREDFTFCRKWARLGSLVCRRENGTVVVVTPAEASSFAAEDDGAPIEPPAVAVAPLEGLPQQHADAAVAASAPAVASAETAATAYEEAIEIAGNDGKIHYGIELGSAIKQAELTQLWQQFLTNNAALVAGLQPRRVLAPDKKWRLIAGPFVSAREAEGACALIKKASKPCEVSVYAGDRL
jgi:hypothetical protein